MRCFPGWGFSACAAGYLASLIWPSTPAYDSKWDAFCTWCMEMYIDPIHPSIGFLADFLVYLQVDKLLQGCNFNRP